MLDDPQADRRAGPLAGLRVIELGGQGPLPFCGMILADLGAEVVTVTRPGRPAPRGVPDFFCRGKQTLELDLKVPSGLAEVRHLAKSADVFTEGFRPGVVERLGIGPDALLPLAPRLVYGRLTGWGQSGPLAKHAGHDINYIGLAGALESIGRRGEDPVPPLALVGDFGGGGLLLAMGICAALVERGTSGRGQVVDAACVDGASLLMTIVHWMRAAGRWQDERGTNLFDSGAPFYDVYRTADGKHVAVGAVEPQFYDELVKLLGIDPALMYPQYDREAWPVRKSLVAQAIVGATREQWSSRADGGGACLSVVLSPAEVADHPHHQARASFLPVDGGASVQPAPAPRFSRTPGSAGPTATPFDLSEGALRWARR